MVDSTLKPQASPDTLDAFNEFAEVYRARINGLLSERLQAKEKESRLGEAMCYSVMNGGKRLRPILVYAACQSAGGNAAEADLPAQAVELIHCYSLVHDDLPMMDNDDLRRGKPTVHRAFDVGTAILAGDALQSLAFEVLGSYRNARLPADAPAAMVYSLSRAIGIDGMAGGQGIDLAASGQQLDASQLANMHDLKTGALIRSSVELGARCSAAMDEAALAQLDRYARCLGLAFQIHDDVLDAVGDTGKLGKTRGADEALNKPTFVSILGVDGAREEARAMSQQAIDHLAGLGPASDPLRGLAQFAVVRDH